MGIGATMFLLAIAGQSSSGGATGYGGGSSDDLIPICIATTLDPNSYRADPVDANKSTDFLQELEGRFSIGVSGALEEQYKKSRPAGSVSPFLYQPYSASVERNFGTPDQCMKNSVRLTVTTRYLTVKRRWDLRIMVQVRQKTRLFRYGGPDEYHDCRVMCTVDSFGGMSPAVWTHRAELFDFIWGTINGK